MSRFLQIFIHFTEKNIKAKEINAYDKPTRRHHRSAPENVTGSAVRNLHLHTQNENQMTKERSFDRPFAFLLAVLPDLLFGFLKLPDHLAELFPPVVAQRGQGQDQI